MAILNIEKLSVSYGPVTAVKGIDLSVEKGKIIALLGANGAGKSSTVNAIAGLVEHTADRMTLKDTDILSLKTEQRIKNGLTLIPEGRRVFPSLSVKENLFLGGYLLKANKSDLVRQLREMFNLFPILDERKTQLAATLSGGQQQQLAIARALMSRPKIMMFDEPSLGLAPMIVETIFDLLVRLKEDGNTLLVVEQNVGMVLDVADYVYVMTNGEIRAMGTVDELGDTDAIKNAYLGG
ncbi:MAG: ABC transporter ATP-binding protein [bacterium]|nr:ABC transporter ATP-binding protein [bacterium]